ncbi:hypothetical protein FXO37_04615 [Capsicum annuum]|nr:hypothetical protein FXO37_04615 [Capsicum annuum]
MVAIDQKTVAINLSQRFGKRPIGGRCDSYNILNATSLEISRCFHKKIPVLRNVQALVDAKLNFFRMTNDNENSERDFRTDQKMLRDLFVSLQHVEKLSIGSWCLQMAEMFSDLVEALVVSGSILAMADSISTTTFNGLGFSSSSELLLPTTL